MEEGHRKIDSESYEFPDPIYTEDYFNIHQTESQIKYVPCYFLLADIKTIIVVAPEFLLLVPNNSLITHKIKSFITNISFFNLTNI